jgi:hypothetical protein|uniref:Uncharacterized protein n=1 Tax=Picea glauca TaxID=3330 RepID=A0A101LVB2_PICGL|nr:hypothetical protein ABT39_MTgene2117 [Picea glauca]QHR86917.1 hypothetical protein Q903MT_gene924 [Picea sitchensis]
MDLPVWLREGSFYPVIVEGEGLRLKVLYRGCFATPLGLVIQNGWLLRYLNRLGYSAWGILDWLLDCGLANQIG